MTHSPTMPCGTESDGSPEAWSKEKCDGKENREPRYIAMGQGYTFAEKQYWWQMRQADAVEEGCDFFRYSVHPGDPCLILLEGWKGWPDNQGDPRWFMTRNVAPSVPLHPGSVEKTT